MSDLNDLLERFAQRDVQGLLTEVRREPLVTVGTRFLQAAGAAGIYLGKTIDEYLEASGGA